MPPAPRIPHAEWDVHKERIRTLYIVENKTLEDTVECIAQSYGFRATKAQYVRRLKRWGIEKNITSAQWKHAGTLIQKRTMRGKETELVIGDQVITARRLKKEIRRHASQLNSTLDLQPGDSRGVTARTPPSDNAVYISFSTIPWLRFQSSIETLVFSMSNTFWGQSVTAHALGDRNQFNGQMLGLLAPSYARRELPKLPSKLQERLTQQWNDTQAQQLVRSEPLLQVLSVAVFMCSNCLHEDDWIDQLVRRLDENGYSWVIEPFIQSKGPTVEIFASTLLRSTVRLGKIGLVQALLLNGVKPNGVDGCGGYAEDPLAIAVMAKDTGMIRLLIRYGADASAVHLETAIDNLSYKIRWQPSLGSHVSKYLEVIDILIRADVSVSDPELLQKVIRCGNIAAAKLLLKAKAPVNEFCRSGSALHTAAQIRNVDMVRTLLQNGADINFPLGFVGCLCCRPRFSMSPLNTPVAVAAANGQLEIVQLLLESGADVNATIPWDEFCIECVYDEGRTLSQRWDFLSEGPKPPLHHSAANGHLAITELLLNWNADARATDSHGNTALHQVGIRTSSIRGPNLLKISQLLLDNGADINAPAGRFGGRTALQTAVEHCDLARVNFLLQRGADVDAAPSPSGGLTALQASVKSGSVELVNILQSASKKHLNQDPKLLGLAIRADNSYDVVTRLLKAGAGVNPKLSSDGNSTRESIVTPLNDAIFLCNPKVVRLLLEHGASTNDVGGIEYQYEWLEYGTNEPWEQRERAVETVLSLIAHGVNVNAPTTNCTFLQAMIGYGDLTMVKMLLRLGADPNMTLDPNIPYPLLAVMGMEREDFGVEVLRTLIYHNADVELYAPLEDWKEWGDEREDFGSEYFDISSINAGIPVLTPLQAASVYGRGNAASILLEAGAEVNAPAGEHLGVTALQGATLMQEHGLVRTLLAAGADIDAPISTCNVGFTALQWAILKEDDELCDIFLNDDADVNLAAASEFGKTALQTAAFNNNIRLVQSLLTRGADVNAPPCRVGGATALQYAAIRGNFDMVVQLVEHGADINAAPSPIEGRTALNGAAEHGRLDIVHFLLENDNEAESLEERCEQAAAFAEREKHLVVAKTLREWKKL